MRHNSAVTDINEKGKNSSTGPEMISPQMSTDVNGWFFKISGY